MPIAPTRNLYIWKSGNDAEESSSEVVKTATPKSEETMARDDNVLLERRYLTTYWHYFRASIGV